MTTTILGGLYMRNLIRVPARVTQTVEEHGDPMRDPAVTAHRRHMMDALKQGHPLWKLPHGNLGQVPRSRAKGSNQPRNLR